MRFLIAVALAACGPRAHRPSYDTAKLARELHVDLQTLGAIAKQHRGNCPTLVAALDPHVQRMRAHAEEVKHVQQDTELAKQLRRDVAAYDEQNRDLANTIGADLGASYQSCPDNKLLLEVIDRIPEL